MLSTLTTSHNGTLRFVEKRPSSMIRKSISSSRSMGFTRRMVYVVCRMRSIIPTMTIATKMPRIAVLTQKKYTAKTVKSPMPKRTGSVIRL